MSPQHGNRLQEAVSLGRVYPTRFGVEWVGVPAHCICAFLYVDHGNEHVTYQ